MHSVLWSVDVQYDNIDNTSDVQLFQLRCRRESSRINCFFTGFNCSAVLRGTLFGVCNEVRLST